MVPATSVKFRHGESDAGQHLHKEAIYAAFALAAGMGFGRFAFTGMAPVRRKKCVDGINADQVQTRCDLLIRH